MTHDGHLLILLHTPTMEEALANFVYGEDQLAAHGAYIVASTSSFKVTYRRLCRAA
jgi:hypothetical protein